MKVVWKSGLTWPDGSVEGVQLLELQSSLGTAPSHGQNGPLLLAPHFQVLPDVIRSPRHAPQL